MVVLFLMKQLCPILAYFKKKCSTVLIELRRMLLRKTIRSTLYVQLGNYLTPRILIFCRFTGFTKMQLT